MPFPRPIGVGIECWRGRLYLGVVSRRVIVVKRQLRLRLNGPKDEGPAVVILLHISTKTIVATP
jgi:hypothetical protein